MARKISSREKMALAAGAVAVALFVFSKWIAVPVVRFVSGAPEQIEAKLTVLEAYQAVVARGPGLESKNSSLDAALERYSVFFLPGEKPPLAAAALERRLKEFAAEVGLKIVSQKILAHRTEEFSIEIPVQIVATGTIENFRDFIVLLQGEEVYIGIEEMAFRSLARRQPRRASQKPERENSIQATMTVAGFIPPQGGI